MRLDWTFNTGYEAYTYLDDAFRFTSQPKYASGSYAPNGGYSGGALKVTLGGIDETDVLGMSGGWSKSFTLDAAESVKLTFRYKLDQGRNYESNEYSDLLVAVDGRTFGTGGNDYIARIYGDGDGGANRSTGWQTVTIDLGQLGAGNHTIKFGGFNNGKTSANEVTKLFFDDITLESAGSRPPAPPSGGSRSLEAFEARVLELTNEFRVENGRAPLANDAKLNAAAEDWSKSMALGDFFRHSTPAQVEEQGYNWRAWGENIAAGYQTPESVVQGWINSPGHRANMLSSNYQEIGVGYYNLANDTGNLNYRHYWTQAFGTEANDTLLV